MIVALVVVFLVLFLLISYVKAPPSFAYIISGLSKEPRVLIGSGGFRIPFFERLDKVYLGQITVDIKTEESVPTNDFINVTVDAVAKIRVADSPEGIKGLQLLVDMVFRRRHYSFSGVEKITKQG